MLEFPGYDRKMVVTGASKDGRYLLVKEPGLLGMRGEIRADKPINFNKPLKNVRVGLPWGPKETIYGTNPRKKRKVRKR